MSNWPQHPVVHETNTWVWLSAVGRKSSTGDLSPCHQRNRTPSQSLPWRQSRASRSDPSSCRWPQC